MLVLFIYAMLLFSRLVVSMTETGRYQYLALVVLQLLTFALPAAIWYRLRSMRVFRLGSELGVRGRGYISSLRLTRPRLCHSAIIISALFALIAGCLLLSIRPSGGSTLDGSFTLYDTFAARKDGTLAGAIGLILAYAALPAVCEELVFRGILCAEYERSGVICAFAMNTLWFGFLHFNIAKLVTYLFAGLVLTALLYATRSLYVTMIVHFLYNLFGLFGQQYITEFYITAGSVGVLIFILIAILMIAAAVFCGEAKRLYRKYAENDAPSDYREPHGRGELSAAFRGVLLTPCAVICLTVFVGASVVFIFI